MVHYWYITFSLLYHIFASISMGYAGKFSQRISSHFSQMNIFRF